MIVQDKRVEWWSEEAFSFLTCETGANVRRFFVSTRGVGRRDGITVMSTLRRASTDQQQVPPFMDRLTRYA